MSSKQVISGDIPPCTHRNCWFKRAARGRQSNVSIHASYTCSEYLIRPIKGKTKEEKQNLSYLRKNTGQMIIKLLQSHLMQANSKRQSSCLELWNSWFWNFFHGAPVAYQALLHYFPHKCVVEGDTAYYVCIFYVLCSVCCIKLPNTHKPLNFIQGSSIPLNIWSPPKGAMLVSVSHPVVPYSLRPHGLQPSRPLCPWDFPRKDTGVGCHFLLQGIFPTQGSNLGLLHCRRVLHRLSHTWLYKLVLR